ncbi:hypothetical protein AB0E85_17360 [Streptomyces sp. NPDC029044]|uniref:hypothetical protein n=1 Tax=Streptomyces sp. NPDC029044 TaxID=3157198 RepID=UPI0033F5EF41
MTAPAPGRAQPAGEEGAQTVRILHGDVREEVVEQGTPDQEFSRALGGVCVEKAPVSPPGGVSSRPAGSAAGLRFTWADTSLLAQPGGR